MNNDIDIEMEYELELAADRETFFGHLPDIEVSEAIDAMIHLWVAASSVEGFARTQLDQLSRYTRAKKNKTPKMVKQAFSDNSRSFTRQQNINALRATVENCSLHSDSEFNQKIVNAWNLLEPYFEAMKTANQNHIAQCEAYRAAQREIKEGHNETVQP